MDDVIQCRGFRARGATFTQPAAFPKHPHRGGPRVLVYEGEWTDHTGSRTRVLARREALFHPGPVEHETSAIAGTSVILIDVAHEALGTFSSVYGNRLRAMHVPFDEVPEIPDRILAEIGRADEATALVVHSLVLQFLAIGARSARMQARRRPEWMARIVEYIHANLGKRLTVHRLAAIAAVSESHLSHSFARFLDCSVSDYIRDCRLRAAARTLRRTRDTVQQIALDLGFSDQAHLTRTFKSSYGVTPTEYRAARAAWDEVLWLERASNDV